MIGRIAKVRKRDGRLVDFDEVKIADAIFKAACAVGHEERFLAEELAGVVTLFLEKRHAGGVPGIEEIQDMVERVLIETGHARMAKAYILYREKRARAREQVRVTASPAAGPRVNSPSRGRSCPWSKARICAALVQEADLDEKIAAEVAARVEQRVFDSGATALSTAMIRSLVEAELLLMGYSDRVGRQALVGLPRYDLDRLLRSGKGSDWRPSGPGDLKRAVADAVLGQYALLEVYGAEVVDAHLDARLHILDVGSPFEWVGAIAALSGAGDEDAWVEGAALLCSRLASVVTREVTVTGLLPPDGGRPSRGWEGGAGGALAAARRLLGHSALRAIDRRGGRFRLALSLPILPSGDVAAALAEALVREHWARFRDGHLEALPELMLEVAPARIESDVGRRRLLPVLAAAAETGRVRLALDRDELASLSTPWMRVPVADITPGVAQPVAGAVAINVGALASAGSEAALFEGLDGAIDLAVKALRQKRTFLEALMGDPGAPLYRVAGGAKPLLAGHRGFDLIHLVGAPRAAAALEREPLGASRLLGRLRAYAGVRAAEEGRRVRLRVLLAPDRDGEARQRLLEGEEPPQAPEQEPFALPPSRGLAGVEALQEPASEQLVLRFPREAAPAPEPLFELLCLLAREPRVRTLRLQPWPDRSIRTPVADS